MTENYPNIDALLAKKFAGESTPEEAETIAGWLSASPDNARYLADAQWLWDHVPEGRTVPDRDVDTEKALQKVKGQLHTPHSGVRIRALPYWWQAAAAVLVLAIAAVYFLKNNPTTQRERIAAQNTLLTDTLTDGSVITLNTHSDLVIAKGFNQRERRMRLQGEGYFKVAPDKTRPFVVEIEQLEVTVVGTAFNVDALTVPGQVNVTVTEGKVQLKSSGQTELLLPGESAVYEQATGKITRQSQPGPNVLAYQNRRFQFDATPLKSVIQQINTAYDVEIILKNNGLADCPLTTKFNEQPLERVLEILVETFSFKIVRTGNQVILEDGQCNGE